MAHYKGDGGTGAECEKKNGRTQFKKKIYAYALSQKTASQVMIEILLKCVSQNPQRHPKSLLQMYPMVDYLKCHGKTDALIPWVQETFLARFPVSPKSF